MMDGRESGWAMSLLVLGLLFSGCGGCEDPQERGSDIFGPSEYGSYDYVRAPSLEGPQQIDFGELLAGEQQIRVVEYRNVGKAELEIERWEISPEFEMSFMGFAPGETPRRIAAGSSVSVELLYRAREEEGQRGKLKLWTNDPEQPEFTTDLLANLAEPCLEFDEEVDFGIAPVGESQERTIELYNCSTRVPLDLRYSRFEGDGAFELGFSPDEAIVLEPQQRREIAVRFSAQEPGEYEGRLELVTVREELEREPIIKLKGRVQAECPVAVLKASHPERGEATASPRGELLVEPLDTIEFNASDSYDPGGGQITRYQLSLIAQPEDSTVRLSPEERSGSSADLFMDLYGEYVLELAVFNEFGERSCEPARLTLRAISTQDIHLQLVWDTPSDPEQTDGSGSDVDLHFLRVSPGARWNEAPYDIFWQNESEDWGRARVAVDNPTLDIDDVDGAGPENINLNNPEPEAEYDVGVHYFSDHGYGPSFVTVRVYLNGQLAVEERRKSMRDQQFWHVYRISRWPMTKIERLDKMYSTFPN